MSERQYGVRVPPLVASAQVLAESLGFDLRPEGNRAGSAVTSPSCCLDEVGALLMTLSSSVTSGRIGEIGTGAGVGTAWLASGMRKGVSLYTVELDQALSAAANRHFVDHPSINVLAGDWREAFANVGPYRLLFADGGGLAEAGPDVWALAAALIEPGGIMVIDDLTPEALWPESWRGQPDAKREFAFTSGLFESAEVLIRPDVSALVMVRL